MNLKDYEEAKQYILDIPKFSSKNQLDDIRAFYEFLGNPSSDKKIIHVAGTNGKGSVCAYLDSILRELSYKVGLFTSPHLVDLTERVQINGVCIEKEEFFQTVLYIEDKLEQYEKKYQPTFFEYLFYVAMILFQKENMDYIVLETGLGGKKDCTNIIKHPILCVITKIGLDHVEYLGDTLEKIAMEKAGIIKKNIPLLTFEQSYDVNAVFVKECMKKETTCKFVSKEEVDFIRFHNNSIDFSIKSRYDESTSFSIHTNAKYQVQNAVLAIRAIEEVVTLNETEYFKIADGIRKMALPGRMEEVLPNFFLDGAHNCDGIEAFIETVSIMKPRNNVYLFFSAVEDKEYKMMKQTLVDTKLFTNYFTAPIASDRGLSMETLQDLFQEENITICSSVTNAIERLLKIIKKEDYVYVVGSLYLIGEVKAYLLDKYSS
ncbi:MAG: bifunctional folylpolyglutamate synthase/dihydrofolate synthase [Lachnospiraceae bacterium]